MRVTERAMFETARSAVQTNQEKLLRIQEQLAESKRVTKPSDDPRAAEKLRQLKGALSEKGQFQRNITFAKSWLECAENAIGSAENVVIRAKELATQMASGEFSAADRANAAVEVDQLRQELIGIGNSQLGSDYLFGGFRSDAAPYDTGGVYQGDSGGREVRIGPTETITANVPGNDVFGSNASGLLADLQALHDALSANDVDGVRSAMDTMDAGLTNLSKVQSMLGAADQRVQRSEQAVQNVSYALTTQISQLEDLDMADAAMNLTRQEAALQASIQVAGQISSLSLVSALTTA